MCSISLTVVVSARWNGVVMRPAIWSGGRPVYCQTTPMTGMRISGKMSVGVRKAASGPIINRSSASTTKVYGRLSAMRTSAIIKRGAPGQVEGQEPPSESLFVGADLPELRQKPSVRRRFRLHILDSRRGAPGLLRPAGAVALSGSPDRVEKFADFELEAVAVAGQRLRRREHLR